jgi:hypothetical protein
MATSLASGPLWLWWRRCCCCEPIEEMSLWLMAWGVMVACIYIGWEMGSLHDRSNLVLISYNPSYPLGILTNSKSNPLRRWGTILSTRPYSAVMHWWHHRWCHDDAVIRPGNKEKKKIKINMWERMGFTWHYPHMAKQWATFEWVLLYYYFFFPIFNL